MRLEYDWLPVDLPGNVEIGEHVYLHSAFAFRHYRSVRPTGVRIGPHCSLYDATMFELGPDGEVDIGAYCLVNSSVFIANSRIEVGRYTFLSYEVYLTDEPAPVAPTDDAYRAPPADQEPSIVIGEECWIGMRTVVLRGTRLGRGVIVGAGSVVQCEAPDYAIVAGNPARVVGSSPPQRD